MVLHLTTYLLITGKRVLGALKYKGISDSNSPKSFAKSVFNPAKSHRKKLLQNFKILKYYYRLLAAFKLHILGLHRD